MIGEDAPVWAPPRHLVPGVRTSCRCVAAGADLLAELAAEPWGQISPSVYETSRVVTLTPWLTGHEARVEFLVRGQRADGSWGGPCGYALVPTLGATEALLTTLVRATASARPMAPAMALDAAELLPPVERGLDLLSRLLRLVTPNDIPDTPAIEIIVPALVALINQHLDRLPQTRVTGLDPWRGSARLPLPAGMDDRPLAMFRSMLGAGSAVPIKLLHSLELAGPAAAGSPRTRPLPLGTVGASPAATAAWLGDPCPVGPGHRAVRYLEAATVRHDGPVPSFLPLTAFERAWVLGSLASAAIDLDMPDDLVTDMHTTLGETGTPGGPGLPPDADTTSVTLHVLAQLGAPGRLGCLRHYETATHFCTWVGESTPSVTTNAHVLDAVADMLPGRPDGSSWPASVTQKVSAWLCDQQLEDGMWLDRWHASPYYATACATVALSRAHRGTWTGRPAAAIHRAVDWVLGTQRADGSWGRFNGTGEETAYAIQVLLLGFSAASDAVVSDAAALAAARGYSYLQYTQQQQDDDVPPLWHDKDLYAPVTIIRAVRLCAQHLVHSAPSVMACMR